MRGVWGRSKGVCVASAHPQHHVHVVFHVQNAATFVQLLAQGKRKRVSVRRGRVVCVRARGSMCVCTGKAFGRADECMHEMEPRGIRFGAFNHSLITVIYARSGCRVRTREREVRLNLEAILGELSG
jgi:hypothetical protein